MFAELRALAESVRNPHLRALLLAFLDDEPLARMYRTAPAAKHVHHAYLGGLIEHVLSVCRLCHLTSSHYGNVDPDLLLTGAILHDIGKVAELTYERSFGYSSEGQLLGHIVIGLRMLHEKLRQIPDFPPKLQVLVEHLIVSHHGELEYGSPKVPLFPEAMLLHHLDNLDSKMECMRALAEKDRHIDGCWTGYSPSLERAILKKAKYLEDAPAREASPMAPVAGEPAPAQCSRRIIHRESDRESGSTQSSARVALLLRRNCSKHGARIPDAAGLQRQSRAQPPVEAASFEFSRACLSAASSCFSLGAVFCSTTPATT